MINFNQDLFSVASKIFEKHDHRPQYHHAEPWSDDLWAQLQESGFTAIGSDAAVEDHAALAKAVGMYAIALPLVDVGLARWVADHAGLELPDDIVVACAGLNSKDAIEGRTLENGQVSISGTARRVPWGRHADLFVVPVQMDGQVRWAKVSSDGLTVHESVNFASEPRDNVSFTDVRLTPDALGSQIPRLKEVQARGALLRSAAGVGAMEFVLEASLTYAQQRFQFDRPISSFQAVQHHLVLIAEATASVASAVDAAVFSTPEQRLMMVAAAKVMLGEQAAILTRIAHQVHGAIGATEEHPLQSRTRRLWSWQDEFGTATDWAVELADQLIFPDSPGAWQVMTPPLLELSSRDVSETVPW